MKRETAWRVFAGEYNDSNFEVKGSGEKTPSYIITPLGAKVNRLFIVGVLTDVENISESGELVRAHISDPTGVYTLYSGQYQQDATDALSAIEVPAFVAVLGKARTYKPEEGVLYVSVRPEKILEVNADARDQWILETCESTKERIEAVLEAMKMSQSNSYDLRKLGYSRDLSDGVVAALKNYGNVDIEKYITLIQESLQYLRPRREELAPLDIEDKEKKPKAKKTREVQKKKEETVEDDSEEIENKVLDVIKEIEGENGASWDAITKKCEKSGLSRDSVEEALNSLMDKGLIYEPVLGTIKTT
jgi:RPA family protein